MLQAEEDCHTKMTNGVVCCFEFMEDLQRFRGQSIFYSCYLNGHTTLAGIVAKNVQQTGYTNSYLSRTVL